MFWKKQAKFERPYVTFAYTHDRLSRMTGEGMGNDKGLDQYKIEMNTPPP